MGTLAAALVVAFYVAMFLALVYFVHKVLWFVKFRRLQEGLVADAERKVREATSEALSAWDKSAHSSWSSAADDVDVEDDDPVAFVRRMEARLMSMDRVLAEREGSVRTWFLERLDSSPSGEVRDSLTVLTMPRIEGGPVEIALELTFPRVRRPTPPPDDLYTLEVRSRYGFWRRALAFVLGAADVVYSSSHVARMSQNVQVPASVIIRRLSLVVVILGAIVIDIAFSLRARLIDWVAEVLGEPPYGFGPLDEYLATGLALGGWLAVYGAIYFGLYLFLRRRSQVYLRRLAGMRQRRQDDLDAIYDHHLRELTTWAAEYGQTLDGAVGIAARQARLLLGRSVRRLRRRLASEELSQMGERIAGRLFSQLPESSSGLQDVATRHEHSVRHALWPRVEEMGYQVELARTRAAWRRVEAGLAELRAERPDPGVAHGMWRTLAVIARMFPEVIDEETVEALEASYDASVKAVVSRTEADLGELDRRLEELGDGLREQLAVAGSLLETQVELAEQSMEAEVADLAAELLEVREGARLEAMAFEI
ncbi:MAG TPA: hypothetical protein RMH99_02315 [Sandaracinaceae bacterium LLY-WYZ-13_1]|nr:hypothetical protein [Sandaracinaceae bacterium LLY-WYZ-13_1]